MLRNEIFDYNMNRLGIVENFTYCQYTEKLSDAGSFTLKCPATETNKVLVVNDNIIWFEDNIAGIIQSVKTEDSNGPFIEANGSLLLCILDWRYIYPVFVGNGKINEIMESVVKNNCISNKDAKRNFQNLEIAEYTGEFETISKQKTGGSVLEFLRELSEAYSCGMKIDFYPKEKKMRFSVIKGKDRSVSGRSAGNVVVFSETLNNIVSAEYTNDNSNYRNVTIVDGEKSDGTRKNQFVFDGEEKSGFLRRELYTDARDLQSEITNDDGSLVSITEEEYNKMLINRGNEKLAECLILKSFESQIRSDVGSAYQYRKDYNLGDVVTIIKESFDLTMDAMVTEVTVTQDVNGYTVTPTVGNGRPTLYSILKRNGVI